MPDATEPHNHAYCCAGLAIVQRELPLHMAALRAEIRENDRLYMQLFKASDDRVVVAMTAAKEAMQTALLVVKEASERTDKATEKRFDEFADKLDVMRDTLSTQITTSTANQADIHGRSSGISAGWGYTVGGAAILAVFANVILHFIH
jgi:hypothetical protein